MGRISQLACELTVHARQADIEARPQEVGAVVDVQIDFGIDLSFGRKLDLSLGGGDLDCTDVASRPCGAEELLRGRMRLRQLQVQRAIAAARAAVAAAGVVSSCQ